MKKKAKGNVSKCFYEVITSPPETYQIPNPGSRKMCSYKKKAKRNVNKHFYKVITNPSFKIYQIAESRFKERAFLRKKKAKRNVNKHFYKVITKPLRNIPNSKSRFKKRAFLRKKSKKRS
jgi:hypothetical protein